MDRLIDYVIVVGARDPKIDATQTPELLRRFPADDYKEFPLPLDVVFFCQPEGCATASKRLSFRDVNSFVFTLTEKDSGITRYGICCNFFRPCISKRGRKTSLVRTASDPYANSPKYDVGLRRSSTNLKSDLICRTLTSLCIISRYPFLSTYRECLFVFRKLIESRGFGMPASQNKKQVKNYLDFSKKCPTTKVRTWSVFLCIEDPQKSPLGLEMAEIEAWLQRMLTIPIPIAGQNRIEVELLPRHVQPPLTFALPEKSRFSLLDFPLHLPLELLGVETCLKVLTCIMLEQKVVLQSRDYNALSICVMALTAMLYPLEYMFPIIPLLPTCLKNAEQLLMAPTPYVIGVPTSFFKYKGSAFQIPQDILLVDLDLNKMVVPVTMDDIPPMPEPEGSILRAQLKQCLACLSLFPPPVQDFDRDSNIQNLSFLRSDSTAGSSLSEIIYGNDIDSVDVAVRAAMVKFFNSPNLLYSFTDHCRVLRLYPRPVVSFQRKAFVASRPVQSEYIKKLSETQALEFYAEFLISPDNSTFRKVQNSIVDPRIVGDKPRWYTHYLQPHYYQVHNPHSNLGYDSLDESESEDEGHHSHQEDQADTFSDIEEVHSDASSLSDLVDDMIKGELSGEAVDSSETRFKPIRLQSDEQIELENGHIPFDSSYSSFNNPESPNSNSDFQTMGQLAMTVQSSVFNRAAHRHESTNSSISEDNSNPSRIVNSVLQQSPYDDIEMEEEASNSDSNNATQKRGFYARTSSAKKIKDTVTRQSSSASSRINAIFEGIKPKLAARFSSESHKSVQSNLSNFDSGSDSDSQGPVRAAPTDTTSLQENMLVNRLNSIEHIFRESSSYAITKIAQADAKLYNSESQLLITEVVTSVKKGDGIGWLTQKRLRRILVNESNRQYVIKQLYTPNEEAAYDTILKDTHVSRNVYRGMLDILKLVIEGYLTSIDNCSLGGVSSLFNVLEIALTHYCGKKLIENTRLPTRKMSRAISDGTLIRPLSDGSGNSSPIHMPLTQRPSTPPLARVHEMKHRPAERSYSEHILQRSYPEVSTNQERVRFSSMHSASEDGQDSLKSMSSLLRRSAEEGLPSLNHVRLGTSTSSLGSPTSNSSPVSLVFKKEPIKAPERNLLCKSNSSAGNRFYEGFLYPALREPAGKGVSGTGRRYVFEGLLSPRLPFWDDFDFWESCFLDAVVVEREACGMDLGPAELMERYKSLSQPEKHRLEEKEDQVLVTLLHNMISYMNALNVDKKHIKRKTRRLLGKSHVGLAQTQQINDVLDELDKLGGNDIDLRMLQSRLMNKQNFVVHLGDEQSGTVFFMEVRDDCMLIKSTNGNIVERWWYEKVVNMSCSPRTKVLCLWLKRGQETDLQKICTKKCKSLYFAIRDSMQKAADSIQGNNTGVDIDGEFLVQETGSNATGMLKVSLEGIVVIFVDKKLVIDIRNLKHCSTKDGILYIEETVQPGNDVICHSFTSDKASDICYSVLCLFSYIAAARNGEEIENGNEIVHQV